MSVAFDKIGAGLYSDELVGDARSHCATSRCWRR